MPRRLSRRSASSGASFADAFELIQTIERKQFFSQKAKNKTQALEVDGLVDFAKLDWHRIINEEERDQQIHKIYKEKEKKKSTTRFASAQFLHCLT